jgi:hypothetical protein
MAASETWTNQADFSTGQVVTQTHWHTYIRDCLTYVKGVLTGSNLQDVTINAAKSLLHGTQHVLRSASTTKQHAEGGSESFNVADLTDNYRTVTFAKAFASAPVVTLGAKDAFWPHNVAVTSLTSSGFSLRVNTNGFGAYNGVITWAALGAD